MKRSPAQATSLPAAFFELTKPNITCMIVMSTALGYYLGGKGIHDFHRFLQVDIVHLLIFVLFALLMWLFYHRKYKII